MKQQETIKLMVKIVISKNISVLFFFFSFLLPQIGSTQNRIDLSEEQHVIINSTFKESKDSQIRIYFQTLEYEPWMSFIWEKEILKEDGIAFCTFENDELKKAFESLKDRIDRLEVRSIFSDRLDCKFKLIRNQKKDGLLFISEPLIIGNYSFQFLKSESEKSLQVLKRINGTDWVYECGVPIQFVLH